MWRRSKKRGMSETPVSTEFAADRLIASAFKNTIPERARCDRAVFGDNLRVVVRVFQQVPAGPGTANARVEKAVRSAGRRRSLAGDVGDHGIGPGGIVCAVQVESVIVELLAGRPGDQYAMPQACGRK